MTKIKACIFAVVAAFLLTVPVFSQTVKLVLNKGARYEATTISKSSSVSSVMGQDMESLFDNTMVQTIEVKDTKDTTTDLVSTVSRITANTSMMGQEMSYDSDKKDNDATMSEGFGKLVGKSKNITINAGGKVIHEDKPLDSLSGSLSMMMGNSLNSGIPMIQSGIVGRSIASGATWLDSVNSSTDKMKITMKGTYLVKQVENNIATIDFSGTQNVSGTIEQMGQEMNMTTTSKVTNQISLNLTNGLIMENTYSISGNGNIDAMGMSIPLTIKSTVNNKIKTL